MHRRGLHLGRQARGHLLTGQTFGRLGAQSTKRRHRAGTRSFESGRDGTAGVNPVIIRVCKDAEKELTAELQDFFTKHKMDVGQMAAENRLLYVDYRELATLRRTRTTRTESRTTRRSTTPSSICISTPLS